MTRRREGLAERRERHAAVDDPDLVLAAALRFLEARPRSIAEVRRRLTQAGYRAELAEGAIERLIELRMLDDEAFARQWIESRDRARPRGERALRQELALKGIERTTTDRLLDERSGEEGAPERDALAAASLLERHARTLDRESDARRRRHKAYTLLARHGFDAETCSDAIRRWETAASSGRLDGDALP